MISIRFLLAILAFFGYLLQYAQKTNMSVSIVCMVNHTAVFQEKSKYENTTISSGINPSLLNVTEKEDKCLFKAKEAAKTRVNNN